MVRGRSGGAAHARAGLHAGDPARAQAAGRAARPVRRSATRLRPRGAVLPPRRGLGEPDDPRRLAAGDGQPHPPRGLGRQGADDLRRPALRDQVRLQLPAAARPARRQGPPAGPDPRAGDGQGVPRHLDAGRPLLPGLPARPAGDGARAAHRHRQHLRPDQRRKPAPRTLHDGRGIRHGELRFRYFVRKDKRVQQRSSR